VLVGVGRVEGVEQLHEVDGLVDALAAGGVAQRDGDVMEELVDEAVGHDLDGLLLLFAERAEAAAGAVQFEELGFFGLAAQRDDGGFDAEAGELAHEAVGFVGDDALGVFGFAAAAGEVFVGDAGEVVDVVDVDVFEAVDGGGRRCGARRCR
jgi:hypothetical protein